MVEVGEEGEVVVVGDDVVTAESHEVADEDLCRGRWTDSKDDDGERVDDADDDMEEVVMFVWCCYRRWIVELERSFLKRKKEEMFLI